MSATVPIFPSVDFLMNVGENVMSESDSPQLGAQPMCSAAPLPPSPYLAPAKQSVPYRSALSFSSSSSSSFHALAQQSARGTTKTAIYILDDAEEEEGFDGDSDDDDNDIPFSVVKKAVVCGNTCNNDANNDTDRTTDFFEEDEDKEADEGEEEEKEGREWAVCCKFTSTTAKESTLLAAREEEIPRSKNITHACRPQPQGRLLDEDGVHGGSATSAEDSSNIFITNRQLSRTSCRAQCGGIPPPPLFPLRSAAFMHDAGGGLSDDEEDQDYACYDLDARDMRFDDDCHKHQQHHRHHDEEGAAERGHGVANATTDPTDLAGREDSEAGYFSSFNVDGLVAAYVDEDDGVSLLVGLCDLDGTEYCVDDGGVDASDAATSSFALPCFGPQFASEPTSPYMYVDPANHDATSRSNEASSTVWDGMSVLVCQHDRSTMDVCVCDEEDGNGMHGWDPSQDLLLRYGASPTQQHGRKECRDFHHNNYNYYQGYSDDHNNDHNDYFYSQHPTNAVDDGLHNRNYSSDGPPQVRTVELQGLSFSSSSSRTQPPTMGIQGCANDVGGASPHCESTTLARSHVDRDSTSSEDHPLFTVKPASVEGGAELPREREVCVPSTAVRYVTKHGEAVYRYNPYAPLPSGGPIRATAATANHNYNSNTKPATSCPLHATSTTCGTPARGDLRDQSGDEGESAGRAARKGEGSAVVARQVPKLEWCINVTGLSESECKSRFPYRSEAKPFPPKPTRPEYPAVLAAITRYVKCCYYAQRPHKKCSMLATHVFTHTTMMTAILSPNALLMVLTETRRDEGATRQQQNQKREQKRIMIRMSKISAAEKQKSEEFRRTESTLLSVEKTTTSSTATYLEQIWPAPHANTAIAASLRGTARWQSASVSGRISWRSILST